VSGSSALLLVSLTRSALAYDLNSSKDLAIDWHSPLNNASSGEFVGDGES
jgi:hypothetical protein